MPVEFTGAGPEKGDWRVSGRVLSVGTNGAARVLDGASTLLISGDVSHVEPGDLVRIDANTDPTPRSSPPGTATPRAFVAVKVELVTRPTRAPFAWNTETGAFVNAGVLHRLHARARVLEAVRAYFRAEQFLEVETPQLVPSPGLDTHLHAFAVHHAAPPERPIDESGMYPSVAPTPEGPVGYLSTSPEYHMKRLLVAGVARCFQFARCFRAGELGRAHEPEFTMLEWYRAWAGNEDLLRDTEAVVRAAASVGPTPGFLTVGGASVPVGGAFERLTVREAFARYAPSEGDPLALADRDEERFSGVLVDRIEPNLGIERPTFLTRYPASQASLARLCEDDPTVCERTELYVRGVELCNGFSELTDAVEQRVRLQRDQRVRAARGLPVFPIDERFVASLEEGMPPSVGNALGIDRLVSLVLGQNAIADVMAFPERRR